MSPFWRDFLFGGGARSAFGIVTDTLVGVFRSRRCGRCAHFIRGSRTATLEGGPSESCWCSVNPNELDPVESDDEACEDFKQC